MTEQFSVDEAIRLSSCGCSNQMATLLEARDRHERMLQDIRLHSAPILIRDERLTTNYLKTTVANPIFNPSVVAYRGEFVFMSRSSSLRKIRDNFSYYASSPHDTINVIHRLDKRLDLVSHTVLDDSLLRSSCASAQYGLEDSRLFAWGEKLWAIGAGVSPGPGGGLCVTQILVRIDDCKIVEFFELPSPNGMPEKNWIPYVKDDRLFFVYSFSPMIVYEFNDGRIHLQFSLKQNDAETFSIRGGTPFVPWRGGLIGVVHTAPALLDKYYYQHMFVALDSNLNVLDVGEPWFIQKRGIEFACGLTEFNGNLLLSYGVSDRASAYCVLPASLIDRWVLV